MRKPYPPKYNPETDDYFYDGRYYDEYPRARYEEDLTEWAEEDDR